MLHRIAAATSPFHHRISASTTTILRHFSTSNNNNPNSDTWNDAWETAWLPDDTSPTSITTAPWDSVTPNDVVSLPPDADPDTTAFISDMNENWDERRQRKPRQGQRGKNDEDGDNKDGNNGGLYSLENVQKDYRLKKQRIHASLWAHEIDKIQEAKLGVDGGADDLDKLLDSCSEIFDSPSNDINNPKVPSTSEFKNKPDGWESLTKAEDGSVWEMSQREEDILLQEFERRMAFCKFQIASFIKTHIFSRRRPIDGWKYMIEVIGPNAQKGKGSVSRLPSLADPATQAFTEDKKKTYR
ncbi:protein GAMETE CELL DEFECTIVE 1, mitochondrial [Silene latifolia]|uniref:protein GAMETE CELL DEFECTIVE 1, mitochondrial n=1 Tax=Silene latifolia TaxID=37657 RepID=UPI003D784402